MARRRTRVVAVRCCDAAPLLDKITEEDRREVRAFRARYDELEGELTAVGLPKPQRRRRFDLVETAKALITLERVGVDPLCPVT